MLHRPFFQRDLLLHFIGDKTIIDKAPIDQSVGKVINSNKIGKHCDLQIADGYLRYTHKEESIAWEYKLDGVYVARTNERSDKLSAENTVLCHKNLCLAEHNSFAP